MSCNICGMFFFFHFFVNVSSVFFLRKWRIRVSPYHVSCNIDHSRDSSMEALLRMIVSMIDSKQRLIIVLISQYLKRMRMKHRGHHGLVFGNEVHNWSRQEHMKLLVR
jgi:hypothetical protein